MSGRRRPRRPAARGERADDDDLGSRLEAAAAEDGRGQGGADRMRIGPLLAHLRELEAELAAELRSCRRTSPRRPRRLPPVPHLRGHGTTSARRSSSRCRTRTAARPTGTARSGRAATTCSKNSARLYLRTRRGSITWTMAVQAAKAARDQELLALATDCQSETETQASGSRPGSRQAHRRRSWSDDRHSGNDQEAVDLREGTGPRRHASAL